MEAEVARGGAYAYGAFACGGDPFLIFGGPVLELARGYVEGDGFGFTGIEVDAIEGCECADGELDATWNFGGCSEVDLGDFIGGC